MPLTQLAVDAFRNQIELAGKSEWLFPSDENPERHIRRRSKQYGRTLRRAGIRILPDLRSAVDVGTRLSAGGVADEWVTQLLRQGDAKVFKKYSQMQLQMKREALAKLDRWANERGRYSVTEPVQNADSVTVLFTVLPKTEAAESTSKSKRTK